MNQLTKRQKELLLNNIEDLKAIVYAYDADKLVLFDEFAKQFEEKKKDWEIISYFPQGGSLKTIPHNGVIKEVKYKDQVFTIGEMTDKGKILNFQIVNGTMRAGIEGYVISFNISEIKKVEKKSFITDDDETVYTMEGLFIIDDDRPTEMLTLSDGARFSKIPYRKYFKSKEKAEEHILLNSPKLSVNDVKEELHNKYGERNETCNNILKRLTSLVKSKSKSI